VADEFVDPLGFAVLFDIGRAADPKDLVVERRRRGMRRDKQRETGYSFRRISQFDNRVKRHE
jgi:hypothetical protein